MTGVALITFLAMSLGDKPDDFGKMRTLIIWIFAMRILMILTSLVSYYINEKFTVAKYGKSKTFDPEKPLTHLVWLTSAISIGVTFGASYLLLKPDAVADVKLPENLWWVLSIIISCGTAAGALIPEFTKIFTSTKSKHVNEVVTSANQGGASLGILSGFVAGNFSAFWTGSLIMVLMLIASLVSGQLQNIMPPEYRFAASIFAFGLVAFGFLGMGPVTIAVDSFGPVTDNAQSVYESRRSRPSRTSRTTSRRISASTPISRMPSTSWNPTTARATRSRPRPSPC